MYLCFSSGSLKNTKSIALKNLLLEVSSFIHLHGNNEVGRQILNTPKENRQILIYGKLYIGIVL
jgi:hypothetical protein